jgi:hypothetical protein
LYNPHPIFTLPTLTYQVYIVVDPGLAASVQISTKVLSFNPLIGKVTQHILGLDDKTKEIIGTNIDQDGPVRCFYADAQDMI